MNTLSDLNQWVTDAGPWLLPLLAGASLVEYVFPPFPGDTITLVGASLAVRGAVPAWAVFVACTLGSIIGSGVDYAFGVWLEERLEHPKGAARWRRWLPPERLMRIEAQYRRWGPWLILSNRFVPVSRALFFVFAGMSRLGMMKTLLLGTVSAMAWNALLIAVGFQVGANLEKLQAFFERFNRLALAACGVVALVALVGWAWRRRARLGKRAPSADGPPPGS